MLSGPSYLYWLIVRCEVAFWIVLALALVARYLLHRNAASRVLLVALPALDILLVAFTAMDLRAGTPATFAHGLAAAYVGFTVAFGPVVVKWADRHFAHRFAGGSPPAAAARGWAAVREELGLWLRAIAAWTVAIALLSALIVYVDDEGTTQALHLWLRIAFVSVILWFVFGPLWSLVFFRRGVAK